MATMPPTPLDKHRPEVSARQSPTSTPGNALSPSIGTSTSAIGARARPGVRDRSSNNPTTRKGGRLRPPRPPDRHCDRLFSSCLVLPRTVTAFEIQCVCIQLALGEPEREVAMTMQRDFLLLVTLVTALASPAFGQTTGGVAPAKTASPGTASVPDFSGVWRHGSLPWLIPPASGPGPVTNRSRRADNGVSNYSELVGDYTNPVLPT